jgi:hypothetical protein
MIFSKNTGKLLSIVALGQETEGVHPYKINWKSNVSFSTVDYRSKLLEDEESGAYLQGDLLDSLIRNYEVNPRGYIVLIDQTL